jgi:anti-sigma regulatory factor (Ser/Thr protein kinase)
MSGLTAHLDVPLDGRAPRAARAAMRAVLSAWHFTDRGWLAAAEVVLSELVTNAVKHGGGCLEVQVVAHDRDVTVSVADGSAVVPRRRDTGDGGEGGRGVVLIEALTRRWGVEDHEGGKRVWALLPPCPADPEEAE